MECLKNKLLSNSLNKQKDIFFKQTSSNIIFIKILGLTIHGQLYCLKFIRETGFHAEGFDVEYEIKYGAVHYGNIDCYFSKLSEFKLLNEYVDIYNKVQYIFNDFLNKQNKLFIHKETDILVDTNDNIKWDDFENKFVIINIVFPYLPDNIKYNFHT